MKKLFLVLFMIPLMAVVSCKKDSDDPDPTPTPTDSYEILASYLVDNDMDLPNVLDGWITAAPATVDDLPAFLDTYDIIDIRGASDFDNGHIDGAINTTLAEVLNTATKQQNLFLWFVIQDKQLVMLL